MPSAIGYLDRGPRGASAAGPFCAAARARPDCTAFGVPAAFFLNAAGGLLTLTIPCSRARVFVALRGFAAERGLAAAAMTLASFRIEPTAELVECDLARIVYRFHETISCFLASVIHKNKCCIHSYCMLI